MKKLFYIVVITLLLMSCGEKKSEDFSTVYDMKEAVPAEEAAPVEDISEQNSENQTFTPVEQKIIKTGHFSFETSSVEETFSGLKKMITQQKGYIQNDETSKSYNRVTRSLTIRIPNNGFQPVVDSLSKDVKVFDEKRVELQDVTEEFMDIEARMKAKKELENRYLQLLNKANSVKDILEIEAQLAQIREEIEAKEGRLKYLQNRVNYSTLYISFYEVTQVEHAPSQTYISRLWNALKGGFYGIGEFIIGIITLWPLFVIGGIVFYFIRKKIKNKNVDSKN